MVVCVYVKQAFFRQYLLYNFQFQTFMSKRQKRKILKKHLMIIMCCEMNNVRKIITTVHNQDLLQYIKLIFEQCLYFLCSSQ